MSENNIERKIIIGLITSTNYLQKLQCLHVEEQLFKSSTAKLLAKWCFEYFHQYNKAPFKDIEEIYLEKLKKKQISDDIAEEIEEEILPDLNNEYVEEGINVDYLLDKTKQYFEERHLENHSELISDLLERGKLPEAKEQAQNYKGIAKEIGNDISLKDESVLIKLEQAFNTSYQSVIRFPGKLGAFWNHQLVRDSLVGLMAPEKRGKTFMLFEMALRGCKQGSKVAVFQAGDMSENQALVRLSISLSRKSNLEKYSGKFYIPVKDCIHNQLDTCDRNVRECDFGILNGMDYTEQNLNKTITKDVLVEQIKLNENYKPCHNCSAYNNHNWGAVWLKEVNTGNPLTVKEAQDKFKAFFTKNNKEFKLSTHANLTLSVQEIKNILATWEKEEGFVPDVIIIDYADILVPDNRMEFRHSQNEIWKGLRGLSQEKHCLVVTATQTDSNSYEQDTIKLKNFSEDKRKYSHVTAMYGLNQDKEGKEKKLGVLRINELLLREADYDTNNYVTVLQSLQMGKPFLTSY